MTVLFTPSGAPWRARLVPNPRVDRGSEYPAALRPILSLDAEAVAAREIASWPGYAPTPLRDLPGLAHALGIAAVTFKEEQHRFGLRSFKALGGAYAVRKLAAATAGPPAAVCCATDGNHGRSVAWGARAAGLRCVIYVHEGVSEGRAEAIRANAVPTVLEMLHAESVEAQYQAAMALSLLTFDQAEKAEGPRGFGEAAEGGEHCWRRTL
jgi:diaminopropionate ammonia-lyase